MVKLWATMVKYGYKTIDDVPARYLEAVKKELGIEDEPKEVAAEVVEAPKGDAESTQQDGAAEEQLTEVPA